MRQYIFYILLILLCFWPLSSCTEFLSPDAKEESIDIISPRDSLYISESSVSFWWEENQKAENYRFQLVSPEFENPSLIFDTLTLETILGLDLGEGRYLWRIRIENEGSFSGYQQRSFVLDQTEPLLPQALDSDSLDQSAQKQLLRWISLDQEIDGISFPTRDSIYLSSSGANPSIIASTLIELEKERLWDITSLGLSSGQKYSWEIVSIDQAGNKKRSKPLSFYLK